MMFRRIYYVLDANGEPERCDDWMRWAKWFEDTPARIVAREELPNGVQVSTVFLGLDHNFFGRGAPVLWETMIFGGPHNDLQVRYTSRAAALDGHAQAVQLARTASRLP